MGGEGENQSMQGFSVSGTDSWSAVSSKGSDSALDRLYGGNGQTPYVVEDEADGRRFSEWKRRILQQTQMLKKRADHIEQHRQNILSYSPGQWLVETGGILRRGFAVPKVTTLLLVGPVGSGKSTLINNLLRVVNALDHGFDRSQVCDDLDENGTYFLEEYVLCENSKQICAFDTRGLSETNLLEDLALLEQWIKDGVHHGQMILWSSDSSNVKHAIETKGRHGHHKLSEKRDVNFVIFVVSAVAIHRMRTSRNSYKRDYLVRLFKSPYLTFKDDRPVVVLTHGDELCMDDRITARIYLGKVLGISPVGQIFDIAGFTGRCMDDSELDLVRDMALLEMLDYTLQRADRNLPYKFGTVIQIKQAWGDTIRLYDTLDGIRKTALLVLVFCWLMLFGLFLAVMFVVLRETM